MPQFIYCTFNFFFLGFQNKILSLTCDYITVEFMMCNKLLWESITLEFWTKQINLSKSILLSKIIFRQWNDKTLTKKLEIKNLCVRWIKISWNIQILSQSHWHSNVMSSFFIFKFTNGHMTCDGMRNAWR